VTILGSVVIGAGQAGLSTSYHLARRGIEHVVLDGNDRPGGAWQHRWDALTMHDVHRVADLPGARIPADTGAERANQFVPSYFAAYEARFDLPVERPVRVRRVHDEDGLLVVEAEHGARLAHAATYAGVARGAEGEGGWSVLVTCRIERAEVGDEDGPVLGHRRGHFFRLGS
jgi:cation diffusion facilitator CzcD-associated flavoprotein CzcO